jgi:Flp pilus assembly protein TadD
LAQVDSLLAQGLPDQAAERALAGVKRWGNDPLYGWQLQGRAGAALVAAGRSREAVAVLEPALQLNPRDGALHHQLGLALAALGRRGRALAEFDEAAALDPSAVAPRLEAGRIRGALGDWGRARADFEAARRLCGGCPEADRLLGSMLMSAGRPGDAVAPLQRLWQAQPAPEVRRHLLAALAGAGADSAVLALVSATPCAEWTGDDWRMAVQSESRLGGAGWAGAALKAVVDGDTAQVPVTEDVFWAQASLNLLAVGRADAALEAVDRALALAPDRSTYHNNRAAVLVALGRLDDARRALEAAGGEQVPKAAGEKP